MPIKKLSQQVIAAIAAGEVIQRPSNALKELMENSLDSGANKIAVNISGGGMVLLEVSDDGEGIAPDELTLAVQPHATSKLEFSSQLPEVATLGFRGEALASIATIGKLTIASRPAGHEQGSQLKLTGSFTHEVPTPHLMQPGTQVSVRELFANTPARRKFLKNEKLEYGYCDSVWRSIALANPTVAVSLARDGKITKELPKQTHAERVQALMGKAFFTDALKIHQSRANLTISGYIRPDASSDKHRQIIVLNGRVIADRLIRQAVRKGCLDVLRSHTCPYVIYLEMPQELYDVNTHPSKEEVKFLEHAAVFKFVYFAIQDTIARPLGSNPDIPFTPSAPTDTTAALDLSRPVLPTSGVASNHESVGEVISAAPPAGDLGDAIGHLHGLYLLAQNSQGLLVVDIHAAHERLIYEELKQQLAYKHVEIQLLLDPLELDLLPVELEILDKYRGQLGELGFEIKLDGGVNFLASMPKLICNKVDDPAALVQQSLAELAQAEHSQVAQEIRDGILGTIACHAAVRGSQANLNLADLNQLLRRMEATPSSGVCNHGRPTWRILQLHDLDRYFERGR